MRNHFCQIVFNSDQWFQKERSLRFIQRYLRETGHLPWRPGLLTKKIILTILTDQIFSSYFCKESLSAIPAKSFLIMATGFRGEDV